MKDEIQKLISGGDTAKALKLLATQFPTDAALLQAQFSNGEKQYNLGLLDFSEWNKIQTKVNLAMMNLLDGKGEDGAAPEGNPNAVKVFISYNWDDQSVALAVKETLEQNGCVVTIDAEDNAAGHSIQSFIENSIKSNHFILSIVSKNSLSSGWVGKESTMALFAEVLLDARFIPVSLDSSFNDDEFFIETLESINQNIEKYQGLAAKANQLGSGGRSMQDKLNRYTDLRANFDGIIHKIRGVNTVSIAGNAFESGMKKVLERIKAEPRSN